MRCWLYRSTQYQFQPTLPHRERRWCRSSMTQSQSDFNPRSRTGSDLHCKSIVLRVKIISTHAPAQGATNLSPRNLSEGTIFQPTLPHRERRARLATSHGRGHFNPRSRTGSDWYRLSGGRGGEEFQPTLPHRERRGRQTRAAHPADISTHAPAQGATFLAVFLLRSSRKFQPTLPHRERRRDAVDCAAGQAFQPTLPHRERQKSPRNLSEGTIFQPTLPHRERPPGHTAPALGAGGFQPTLPHRERRRATM